MDKIELFNQIRDIPYHISTEGEPGSDCEDKAKLLVAGLKEQGYEARVLVALFRWSEQDWIPAEVLKIDHNDECSHMYVEFLNSAGNWIELDPTWNRGLVKAGLKINDWDGESKTSLGLNCYKFLSPNDSGKYLENIDYEDDLAMNGDFYRALNKYCDKFKETE